MSNPEDISVILGRIRTVAEGIVERGSRLSRKSATTSLMHEQDAQRILELVEQAQEVTLQSQLEASLKAVKP